MSAPLIFILAESARKTAGYVMKAVADARLAAPERLASDEPFSDARQAVRQAFTEGRPIIGICASGILIRFVADLLEHKEQDALVIAVSDDGAHVVPLLGGHHGANEMALRIAKATRGTAAITTAGETRFGIAFDNPPDGFCLVNRDMHKTFVRRLLEGDKVQPFDRPPFDQSQLEIDADGVLSIVISDNETEATDSLIYAHKTYVLGIGCERNAPVEFIQSLVDDVLAEAGIVPEAIAAVASIDLKHDEKAIREMAARLNVPFCVYTADRLEDEAHRLANPSDVVFKEVGCHGVAEGAALATAGWDAQLIVEKRKNAKATCALASDQTRLTQDILRSRSKDMFYPTLKEFS